MGEVVSFPEQNIKPQDKWELDAHFESKIEADQAVQKGLEETHNWLETKFPNIFMSPGEVVAFLEETRAKIANDIDKEAA